MYGVCAYLLVDVKVVLIIFTFFIFPVAPVTLSLESSLATRMFFLTIGSVRYELLYLNKAEMIIMSVVLIALSRLRLALVRGLKG